VASWVCLSFWSAWRMASSIFFRDNFMVLNSFRLLLSWRGQWQWPKIIIKVYYYDSFIPSNNKINDRSIELKKKDNVCNSKSYSVSSTVFYSPILCGTGAHRMGKFWWERGKIWLWMGKRELGLFLHPERKGMSTMKGQSEEVDGVLYLIFSLPYNLPEIQPLAKPVWLDPSILLTDKP